MATQSFRWTASSKAGSRVSSEHRLRILALEPYYGGSHRAVLDGLRGHISADWTVLSLPARKWKWRMRGAAITFAHELERVASDAADPSFDLIFASTFVNLAEFRGLAPRSIAQLPAIVYFHENQLVYPNRSTAEWDFQFPLTNITSALSADACLFNSHWNLDRFCDEIPGFLRQFPDHHPQGVAHRVRSKSAVIAPPFDPTAFDQLQPTRGARTRIVWPHRWEHDKNPDEFFSAVGMLASEGLDFEVVVAGQSFAETHTHMMSAALSLGDRLVQAGEPGSREEYARLLSGCDVAVSTALNEFFGLAMIESCYAGATPLVPDRLAYRELYPSQWRYSGLEQLVSRLRAMILERPSPNQATAFASAYRFTQIAPHFENAFRDVATGRTITGYVPG